MYATRTRLRALLKALIAERSDSALLYIPHGEAGIRRMISALLAMRPPMEDGDRSPRISHGFVRNFRNKVPAQ